jgi:hypothetical protein
VTCLISFLSIGIASSTEDTRNVLAQRMLRINNWSGEIGRETKSLDK